MALKVWYKIRQKEVKNKQIVYIHNMLKYIFVTVLINLQEKYLNVMFALRSSNLNLRSKPTIEYILGKNLLLVKPVIENLL